MKKDERTRNWTTVVYEDSAPKNWIQLLDDLHIKFAVSPYHDKDINPDGTEKKPHWHVVFVFDNVKGKHQVQDISNECLSGVLVQRVESISGMIRYLTHMDNPEKYQYNKEDISVHGGLDIEDYLAPTLFTQDEILGKIFDFIYLNHVTQFAYLVRYAHKYHRHDWYGLILNQKTYVVVQFIKSIRECTFDYNNGLFVDENTGEVINIDDYQE